MRATAHGIWVYGCGYCLFQLGSVIALQPYTAVLSDCVPEEQRSVAGGWMAVMLNMGNLGASMLGVAIGNGLLKCANTYTLLASMVVGGALISMPVMNEPQPQHNTICCSVQTSWAELAQGLPSSFSSVPFRLVFLCASA